MDCVTYNGNDGGLRTYWGYMEYSRTTSDWKRILLDKRTSTVLTFISIVITGKEG